ncbi:hypothetical protein BDY17DRAFT_293353 [Neohortaea acidophila]|uniref:Uncharacterized protein n=1 Tax=Neohortaea acidophila TaxID=245834 RepID=A0A6A6PZ77_9PEZI|nr:uncharacterized protein BDY17DRAFT_293353 [Neohortaea acidophila]KAF2485312.1 hypothetical protein BDY17DRAFT_293353 [Neohortaea acidophila]
MARQRAVPSMQRDAASSTQQQPETRQALKEKTNTTRSRGTTYDFDENIEELVKDVRPRRGQAKRNNAPELKDDFVMTGGLGLADAEPARTTAALASATGDELQQSDSAPIANAPRNRRPPRTMKKVVKTAASSQILLDLRKRMAAAGEPVATSKPSEKPGSESDALSRRRPTLQQSPHPTQPSRPVAFSSPTLPSAKRNEGHGARSSLAPPNSALRLDPAPAFETSILALKNFKRRPRQPSMLQMVQQRTASARPSAVHIPAEDDTAAYDVEGIEDDDDEFAPEAEGTPLHLRLAKTISGAGVEGGSEGQQAPLASGAAKKRKSMEADLPVTTADESSHKRQRRRGGKPSSGDGERLSTTLPAEIQVINSSPSSASLSDLPLPEHLAASNPEDVVPSTERELRRAQRNGPSDHEQEILSATMAEPASSSPLPDARARTERDIMADPLTQPSPPRERGAAKQRAKTRPTTTATLQSLLPKLRKPLASRRGPSEYDVDSDSEDGEDGAEVRANGHGGRGRGRRQIKSNNTATSTRKKPATASTKTSLRPLANPATKAQPRSTKKANKTYGRTAATTSDKENDAEGHASSVDNDGEADGDGADTSVSMEEAGQSRELAEARRKFAEIDAWDMEFESMSVEEGRSSSQNWR